MLWVGFAVWMPVVVLFSPEDRAWKGNFGRLFIKLPLVRNLHRWGGPFFFWLVWWQFLIVVGTFTIHDPSLTFFIDTARRLDDYFNHDDDSWRKLWEGVRNKVKWKMELPPEPIPNDTV